MYKVTMYNVKKCHLQTYQQPYTRKKREVRLFFTLYKGFAIPQLVEKQPKSTPDIYTQPHPKRAWKWIIHTHGTFIVAVRTSCECCEDSVESQTTSINAFYYVLLFNVSE